MREIVTLTWKTISDEFVKAQHCFVIGLSFHYFLAVITGWLCTTQSTYLEMQPVKHLFFITSLTQKASDSCAKNVNKAQKTIWSL
jgi:hypothetical protein